MADKNSSKNNFIMQAGILAAAGIISRIICNTNGDDGLVV